MQSATVLFWLVGCFEGEESASAWNKRDDMASFSSTVAYDIFKDSLSKGTLRLFSLA